MHSATFVFALTALLAAFTPIAAQESATPPRPPSRILDDGSVFGAGDDKSKIADDIQGKLDALQAETGCDILVVTVTSSTGSSPRSLSEQFASAWLNPAQHGAVLVYERAGNRFAVATTEPVRDSVADYLLTSIEQASQDRDDAPPAETVALAASDLAAVFRKNFGVDAGRDHPAIKADRILMGIVAACIVVLIALVSALHWRGEKAMA